MGFRRPADPAAARTRDVCYGRGRKLWYRPNYPRPWGTAVSDIFREIEDELRQEHLFKLWQRHAKLVVAVVVVLVLALGGTLGWRSYREAQTRNDGLRYLAALALAQQKGLGVSAAAFEDAARQAGSGYRMLAGLQAAAAHIAAGDLKDGIADYDHLAADSSIARRYRDLAVLLSVLHQADTAPVVALKAKLAPLLRPDSPWRYSAQELEASLDLRAGDEAGARKIFAALSSDQAVPEGLKARAAEMLAALGGNS